MLLLFLFAPLSLQFRVLLRSLSCDTLPFDFGDGRAPVLQPIIAEVTSAATTTLVRYR